MSRHSNKVHKITASFNECKAISTIRIQTSSQLMILAEQQGQKCIQVFFSNPISQLWENCLRIHEISTLVCLMSEN